MRTTGVSPTVELVLAHVAEHGTIASDALGLEQAETLLAARGDDLDALLCTATALRDEGLAPPGRPGMTGASPPTSPAAWPPAWSVVPSSSPMSSPSRSGTNTANPPGAATSTSPA